MELKVEIDFDEASKCWRMNKKHIGLLNGMGISYILASIYILMVKNI